MGTRGEGQVKSRKCAHTLERKLPEGERRWVVKEYPETYSDNYDIVDSGWPIPPET